MTVAQVRVPAAVMPVQLNTPIAISTCAGNNDRFDGCGPPGTFEVVFKFTAPSSGGYTIRARDAGTMNVSTMTGRINAGCTGTTTCAALIGTTFTAGQVVYFVIEASSGACVNVDFEVI
jgi:hypothetical protein